MVASAEVFQVQPSAFHSLTAWDTEEILFIGARPLHVRQAISFIDIYIYIYISAKAKYQKNFFCLFICPLPFLEKNETLKQSKKI